MSADLPLRVGLVLFLLVGIATAPSLGGGAESHRSASFGPGAPAAPDLSARIAPLLGEVATHPLRPTEGAPPAPSSEEVVRSPSANEGDGLEVSASGPMGGTCGTALSFSGSASGGTPPYRWNWTFGDGTNSSAQDPDHAFNTTGSFAVALWVTDSKDVNGSASLTVAITLAAFCDPAMTASASATPRTGPAPLTVNFTGAAEGGTAPYRFAWVFGDDSPSVTGAVVNHTYRQVGSFLARVWANDSVGGSATEELEVTVFSSSGPLTPFGNASVLSYVAPCGGSPGMNVSFSASARGGLPPYTFVWWFGAGSSRVEGANVTHVFSDELSATATLSVSDRSGQGVNITVPVQGRVPTGTCAVTPSTILGLTPGELLAIAALAVLASALAVLTLRRRWAYRRGSAPSSENASKSASETEEGQDDAAKDGAGRSETAGPAPEPAREGTGHAPTPAEGSAPEDGAQLKP